MEEISSASKKNIYTRNLLLTSYLLSNFTSKHEIEKLLCLKAWWIVNYNNLQTTREWTLMIVAFKRKLKFVWEENHKVNQTSQWIFQVLTEMSVDDLIYENGTVFYWFSNFPGKMTHKPQLASLCESKKWMNSNSHMNEFISRYPRISDGETLKFIKSINFVYTSSAVMYILYNHVFIYKSTVKIAKRNWNLADINNCKIKII